MQVIFHENIDLLHLHLHTVKEQTNQLNFSKSTRRLNIKKCSWRTILHGCSQRCKTTRTLHLKIPLVGLYDGHHLHQYHIKYHVPATLIHTY